MMANDMVRKIYGHNAQDNRSIHIEVTEKGKQILKDFMRVKLINTGNILDGMSDVFKKELFEGMECLCRMYNYEDSFLVETTSELLDELDYPPRKKEYIKRFSDFVANRLASERSLTENPQRISKNLTFQQIGVLKAICINNANTVSKLVKHFGTSVSTVSVNVSRLAKAGYVIKEYGRTDDNRETILSVTEKAKAELKAIHAECFKLFMNEYNAMSEEKRLLLEEGLEHFDNVVKLMNAEAERL